jgi:hypothetical protein
MDVGEYGIEDQLIGFSIKNAAPVRGTGGPVNMIVLRLPVFRFLFIVLFAIFVWRPSRLPPGYGTRSHEASYED